MGPHGWIESAAAVHATDDILVVLEGVDRHRWLNAVVTADLRDGGSPDDARYSLLLTPAGQPLSDFWITRCGETLVLTVPRARAERVEAALRRYALGAAVDIGLDDARRVLSVQGPRAAEAIAGLAGHAVHASHPCPRLGRVGLDVWVPAAELEASVGHLATAARALGGGVLDGPAWASAHVVFAAPRAGIDFDETTSVHEAGLAKRAVSFTKGCFVGQEAASRQRRGAGPVRRLVQLALDGPGAVAARVLLCDMGGAAVGEITSSAGAGPTSALAMGYVRAELAELGATVIVGDRRATVRRIVGSSSD